METELPRMLAARERELPEDRFVFHSARARMQHVTPEQLRAMNAQAERAATELADARPDVVATACLVAIMAQGPGYHCTAEDTITAALRGEGSDAPVVSSAGALLSGIAALGARKVAIITPYLKPLTELVVAYLEDAGVEVVDALSLEVPDNLAVARLDPADLREHWRKLDLTGADALVRSPACRCRRWSRSRRSRQRRVSLCSRRPRRRRTGSSRSWAWSRGFRAPGGCSPPDARWVRSAQWRCWDASRRSPAFRGTRQKWLAPALISGSGASTAPVQLMSRS
jgi:maleate isomerase